MKENEKREEFDFEAFKKEAIAGLYEGKNIGGEDGLFAPLLKHFLEAALEGEMAAHIKEGKAAGSVNRRNGKKTKTVKSLHSGAFELDTPRDRDGSFSPKAVAKRQVIITDHLEEKVMSLYALGNSYSDIQGHIKEIYAMELSVGQLSEITDKLLGTLKEWRNRPLESMYCFLFLDCMFCKIRKGGKVEKVAVYNVLGVTSEGKKELLGFYTADTEGAKFWLQVLTDLKNRGVQDVLIASVDGLSGFPEAIESVFPRTEVQLCIVHQIRNSLRYIAEKDKKAFAADLKNVYKANSEEEALRYLDELEEKWGERYLPAIKIWRNKWEHLSPFFAYSPEIRRIMYTTNIIEGYHRQVRKVTKTKGAFPSEDALLKLIFAVSRRITEKWTKAFPHWELVLSQLYIHFEERMKPHLEPR